MRIIDMKWCCPPSPSDHADETDADGPVDAEAGAATTPVTSEAAQMTIASFFFMGSILLRSDPSHVAVWTTSEQDV